MATDDRTQQALNDLADWIETWRDVPELLALVSPVARAWLDFVDGHGDTSGPDLARVIRLLGSS